MWIFQRFYKWKKANYNTLLKKDDQISIIESETIELIINGKKNYRV